MFGGLIGVLPNVDNAHRGVKPVEHHQRDTKVAYDGPQLLPVELVSVVLQAVRFHFERLHYPHGHVANDQEGQQLPAGLLPPQFFGVAAAPQPVDDERSLDQDLDHLEHEQRDVGAVVREERRDDADDAVEEERRDADEEEEVVEERDVFVVDVELGDLSVGEDARDRHQDDDEDGGRAVD